MSSPGCRLCEWTPPSSALELMKRDAARTRTSPHSGADTAFHFFFERRIPSGQPVGFPSGLTGHPLLGALSSRLMKRNLASAKGGRHKAAIGEFDETRISRQSYAAVFGTMRLAVAAGPCHPRYIVQFPCHVYEMLCTDIGLI